MAKDSTAAWGVFPHAERRVPTGRGYVVREMQSGHAVDQYNYGGIAPVAVLSLRGRAAAERLAAKLSSTGHNPRKGNMVTRKRKVVRRNPHMGGMQILAPNMAELQHGQIKALYSYGTPVAITAPSGLYRTEKKWPQTTSKHIAKWFRMMKLDPRGAGPISQAAIEYAIANGVDPASVNYRENKGKRRVVRRTRKNPLLAIAGANPRVSGRRGRVSGISETSAWGVVKQALVTMISHAEEMYPHFESERGQRDIAAAKEMVLLIDRMRAQVKRGVHVNPLGGDGKYLGRVMEVRYMREVGKHRNQRFRHVFKSRPALYAMPDGSIRIA